MATDDQQSDPTSTDSRGEPGRDESTAEQPTETVPAPDAGDRPTPEHSAPGSPNRTRWRERRTTLGVPAAAAVAAGLVVVSGLGGYALGNATGEDLTPVSGNTGRMQGFPDRDGDRRGFPGGDHSRDGHGDEDSGYRGVPAPDQGGTAEEGDPQDSGSTT